MGFPQAVVCIRQLRVNSRLPSRDAALIVLKEVQGL
jgi:hypothetical protein